MLSSEETGEIGGSIVDSAGNPLPGFSMSLVSSRSPARSLSVIADEAGRFNLQNVPSGNLFFSTASQPRIEMRGLILEAGAQLEVTIKADIGPHSVEGVVLDSDTNPIAGARVTLTARVKSEFGDTTSYRQANTDSDGRFRFPELGAGPHRLSVSHLTEGRASVEVDISELVTPLSMTLKKDGA